MRAIVDELEKRATQRFDINIGRGVRGLAWKMIIYLTIWLAAYGAGGGFGRLFGK